MLNGCRAATIVATLAAMCALPGCASVTEGTTQQIAISTTPISGATCAISNTLGQWTVVTPGTVEVRRSESVLRARCSKDGWQDATGYLSSRVPALAQAGMMMPYVGLLSAAVDGSTGAANEYPALLSVPMKPAPSVPQTSAVQIPPAAPVAPQSAVQK
jgi:hypothetical protein